MRPFNRPPQPASYQGGAYTNAQQPLVAAIGAYCSYCERYLPAKMDIEHKLPKSLYPGSQLDWTNFLLACANCNSPKGSRSRVYLLDGHNVLWEETNTPDYLCWPDTACQANPHELETFNMIQYQELGLLAPHPGIASGPMKDRVIATLAMVNLGHVLGEGATIARLWFLSQKNETQKATKTKKKKTIRVDYLMEARANMNGFDTSGASPSNALMNQAVTKMAHVVPLHIARNVPNNRNHYAQANAGQAGPFMKDMRVPQRSETWDMATRIRLNFDQMVVDNFVDTTRNSAGNNPHPFQTMSVPEILRVSRKMRRHVINLAKVRGFWSVWVTVFQEKQGAANGVQARWAIVPVLEGLLDNGNFPATLDNDDFNPQIYDDNDSNWADSIVWQRRNLAVEVVEAEEKADELEQELDKVREEYNKKVDDLSNDVAALKKKNQDLEAKLQQYQTKYGFLFG